MVHLVSTLQCEPPSSARQRLLAEGAGRYSAAVNDPGERHPASDPRCERIARCCICGKESSGSVFGLRDWSVVRLSGIHSGDVCPDCAGL